MNKINNCSFCFCCENDDCYVRNDACEKRYILNSLIKSNCKGCLKYLEPNKCLYCATDLNNANRCTDVNEVYSTWTHKLCKECCACD